MLTFWYFYRKFFILLRHWTPLYDLKKAATERKDDISAKLVLRKNAAHRLSPLVVGAQSREPRRTRTSELKKKVHHPCRRICLLCWHCVCVGIVRMVNDYPDTCFSQMKYVPSQSRLACAYIKTQGSKISWYCALNTFTTKFSTKPQICCLVIWHIFVLNSIE